MVESTHDSFPRGSNVVIPRYGYTLRVIDILIHVDEIFRSIDLLDEGFEILWIFLEMIASSRMTVDLIRNMLGFDDTTQREIVKLSSIVSILEL